MKHLALTMMAVAALSLGACETLQGRGRRVGDEPLEDAQERIDRRPRVCSEF